LGFAIVEVCEGFLQIEVLERLKFGVISDYGVEKDLVLGVLVFDYVGYCFEEDV